MKKKLPALIAFILGFGILPSLTGLSQSLFEAFPLLSKFSGPINFLKLGAPVLLVFLWWNRSKIPKPLKKILWFAFFLGSIFTIIGAIRCGFPTLFIREWAVMTLGGMAALSFILLSENRQKETALCWAVLVGVFCFLDLAFPSAIDWLYQHIFDPQTRHADWGETRRRVLTGVFGRQSLAKLLVWLPWLLFYFYLRKNTPTKTKLVLFLVSALFIGLSLATSQRGPFVGALAGFGAFVMYQALALRNFRNAKLGVAAILVALAVTWIAVPKDLLKARVTSLLGQTSQGAIGKAADANRNLRIRMAEFSLKVISHRPFGDACISDQDFKEAGLFRSHAHSLFLEQFRSRGWIWGLFHLFIWLFAMFIAWRLKTFEGAALFSGLTTIVVSGLVDHPWFVLNHSMILCLFLFLALQNLKKLPGRLAKL